MIKLKNSALLVMFALTSASAAAQDAESAAKPKQVVLLKRVAPSGQAAAPAPSLNLPMSAKLPAPAQGAKPQTRDLPGLGVMPGDDYRTKPVRVGNDRNERVYIARNALNKISTPFDDPRAVDSTGAVIKAVGQDIYIQPAGDAPLTVYITNGGQGQSIGVNLVPDANMPAQTIVLEPDTPTTSSATKGDADETVPSDYVARINHLVKTLALGKTPAGFTRSRLPASVVTGKELVIEPLHKFSGSAYDLYAYRVRSASTTPLEMREEAFYTEAVRAVAFYPSAMLQAGEETMVYIVADRPSKESEQ